MRRSALCGLAVKGTARKLGKKRCRSIGSYETIISTPFYKKALADAITGHDDIPIITPEWLVILKYFAGRFRDQQDAVFLLKQKKLVDRRLIRRKITETIGPAGWGAFAVGLKRWYDLADGKITTEK